MPAANTVSNDAVVLDITDGVALVTLNRPDVRNAWDDTLGAGMEETFTTLGSMPAVRAIVLTGAGSAFCSGADLAAGFSQTAEGHDNLRATLRHRFHPGFLAMRDVPQPLIAAVNGPAIGAGACLALAADLSLMGESAFMQFRFAMIGLMPDVGATALLSDIVTPQEAAELLFLAEKIDSGRARELRLIGRVVPDAEVLAEAMALAARIAQGPTLALSNTKRALRACSRTAIERQLEYEAELQQSLVASEDWREGRSAFLEHRMPAFQGR